MNSAAVEHLANFGLLLQSHRLAARLSQQELAEPSTLSRRSISDLERGLRGPLPGTARRLADALHLVGEARAVFIDAAQRRTPAPVVERRAESNLPVALTSFVGRERELAQIRTLLHTARLLTLTGTGGVGKTRLAVEVARGVAADGNQRVCLVELAAITDGPAVARASAAALGVPEQAGRPPLDALKYALRYEQLLLILDNCEQVLQACAELANVLLAACVNVRILATSRERLGIVGETTWRVPSLALPTERMSLEKLKSCDAARLFVERATALVPDFVLSEQDAAAVARVCNRLDGIPHAIELAAAWIPALAVQQIADRLDDTLRLLVRGNGVAPARQQTLRATIAWSYGLLDPAEAYLFDRLSVFAGGWTLEAAAHVCAEPDNTGAAVRIQQHEVVDLLARLIAKSLVIAMPKGTGEMRYRMLETLRQYGRERLTERALAETTSDLHADFFVSWARRKMSPSDTFIPLLELSVELDNLRMALRWLVDQRDTNRALQLGAALRWYWFQLGRLSEGYQWYSEILSLQGASRESEDFAHVLAARALLAGRQETATDAERLHSDVLTLWRRLGNELEVARSLSQLGYVYRHTGRLPEAYGCFEEGAELSQRRHGVIEGLNRIGLAETLYDAERHEEALTQGQRALEICQDLGYARGVSWAKRAIGLLHYQRGAWSVARRFLEESLAEARKVEGLGWWLADALACVGQLDVESGSFIRADSLLREALEISIALGDQRMIARCLERLAYLAAAQDQPERAVRVAAAVDSLRRVAGLPRAPVDSRTLQRWLAPAERGVEPAVREQARREGAAMPLERVLSYALDASDRQCGLTGANRTPAAVAGPSQLSPREREVASLVARGLSNPRIAAELIIGERTVQSHVGNILNKLGMSSRVQIAGWVTEHAVPAAVQHNP